MRITSEVMVTRSLDRLQTRLQAYERTQSELATGRRILQASDDPAGSRRAMSLNAAMRSREQELTNINDARGWLDAADTPLQSVLDRLARVRELATRAASDSTPAEREAMAKEVREIREEIVGIANTDHQGRPLFGGYSAGPAVTGEPGAWGFNGGADQVTRRVSDTELVRVNSTAEEWMGGPGGGHLLHVLDGVIADLGTGDQGAISARIGDLRGASDRVNASLAGIGAATNRVDSARNRAEATMLTLRTELSNVQDVDLAQGIMELQIQQVAYEATLQALAKALPPSLVSFLR